MSRLEKGVLRVSAGFTEYNVSGRPFEQFTPNRDAFADAFHMKLLDRGIKRKTTNLQKKRHVDYFCRLSKKMALSSRED